MKKTLLSALKHGSGILLTVFALLCSCQVWADDAGGKTLYLIPNSTWKSGSAEFCLYYFNNSDDTKNGWASMTEIESGSGVYEVSVPDGVYDWDRLVFVRKDPSVRGCNWDAKWNQTGNLNYSDSYNTFEITGGDGNAYTGDWYNARRYSSGERIYLLNTYAYYLDGNPGLSNQLWYINDSAGHGGTAWIHLWCGSGNNVNKDIKFALLSGEAESDGAIYYVEVGEGLFSSFLITRNGSGSTGPWDDKWNQSANFSIPPVNNRITGTTSSNYSSDFYLPCTEPTVTTASSPAAKGATTATLTGTYTTEDVCVPTAKGVAYKEDGGAYSYLTDGTSASGSINISISDLTPLTTYYYKAYVELEGGKKLYGAEYNFTTDCRGGIVISTQPSSSAQDGCLGSATALSVTASGASDYTYQWYYNSTASVSGATAIPGATASSYTPAVVGTNYYYCSVGAAGGYCEVASNFSGAITIKGVPSLTATPSSVTNYAPVTITASGAEISDWSITSGEGGYLYKKGATSAKFKGNVGSGSAVTYTIEGTAANGCSGTTTVTVNKNADSCE